MMMKMRMFVGVLFLSTALAQSLRDDCVDNLPLETCLKWVELGKCQYPFNQRKCPKSCQVCPGDINYISEEEEECGEIDEERSDGDDDEEEWSDEDEDNEDAYDEESEENDYDESEQHEPQPNEAIE